MKITLRQAHKLVDKITERLKTIVISATKTVSIWDVTDGESTFDTSKQAALELIKRNMELIVARQAIRDLIRDANHTTVDQLVSQRKGTLDIIASSRHLLDTCGSGGITSPLALQQKATALREAAAGTSYGSDTITICLVSTEDQSMIDKNIQEYQLLIEDIENKLTTANATTSISIPVEMLQILIDEGIVAA